MKKCKNHKQNQKLKFLKEYVNSGFSFKMSILRDSNQQTFLMQIWNSLKRRIFDFISIWEWDCIVSEIQPFSFVKIKNYLKFWINILADIIIDYKKKHSFLLKIKISPKM